MIEYEKLKNWKFDEIERDYTERDAILYALGVGVGLDPADPGQLDFVYEKNLRVLPTMAVVLAYPGFWVKDPTTGIDWVKVLHGEHSIVLHKPLPAAGTVVGRSRVTALVDKGKDKGALLYTEHRIYARPADELIATTETVAFCRGDGGFSERPGNGPKGGDPMPLPKLPEPTTPSQISVDLPTSPQAALLYRQSGDLNPLHADPEVAQAAGFARPILHGLATFGLAGHALLKLFCDYDPTRLKSMSLRFSAPVFPGETVRTEAWRDGKRVRFRASVIGQRDVVVLSHGAAELA